MDFSNFHRKYFSLMFFFLNTCFSKNRPLADYFIESQCLLAVKSGPQKWLSKVDPKSSWSKKDHKSGGQKVTPKVAAKSGPKKWRPKVDLNSGGQKTTPKVAAKSGPQKWRSKKDPKSGGQKCTLKVAARSGPQKWWTLVADSMEFFLILWTFLTHGRF